MLASLATLIYLFYPIKAFIVDRELTPLLPIEIMFIDQSTLSGFLIANILMIVMGLYAVDGSLYVALHLSNTILNYAMQVDMIEMDIDELNELWNDRTCSSISKRHKFLRNICMKCQDKHKYAYLISDLLP